LLDRLQKRAWSYAEVDKFRLAKEKMAEMRGIDSLRKGNPSEEGLVAA